MHCTLEYSNENNRQFIEMNRIANDIFLQALETLLSLDLCGFMIQEQWFGFRGRWF